MIRFKLLGSVDLRDSEGREFRNVLAQPKRLALLAFLAAACPAGPHRRDTLLGLFWPELDQEHARNALSKAVHFLRRSLGDGAIVSRGAEDLAIEPSRVWSDVRAFATALMANRVDEALELYRGDLLPSFFVPDAPGFEQWLERERSRLRDRASAAARVLAERHEAGRHLTLAVAAARRAVELSSGDERPLRRLIELLERLGDRAGAVRTYEEFARKLATELDVEPATETVALIERVKSSPLPHHDCRPVASDSHSSEAAITRLAKAVAGRYKVERQLGAGAMAIVALAHDLRHHRRVAIKVLRPELSALMGPERFLREIDIAAGLMHPHILPLHDSGEADGLLYYVMPYVEGESLRGRLEREGRLPLSDALQIGREVADALSYAHHRGFIHRDIKPENILLGGGHALVADFGIARALDSVGVHQLRTRGFGTGTPEYMSPEEITGNGPVDERADVYSLGCVLFEMLSGKTPFSDATSQHSIAERRNYSPRSLAVVRSDISPHLNSCIAKALSAAPSDRFRRASDFASAMGALDSNHQPSTQAHPKGRRWKLGALRALGAAAMMLLVALAAQQLPRQETSFVQIGQRIRVTSLPGLEVHPVLSPGGDLLAYTAGDESRVFIQHISGGRRIPVADNVAGRQAWPYWSPDGQFVSLSSDRGIEIVPALGGTAKNIMASRASTGRRRDITGGSWSPDGREVAFVRGDTLYAVSARGGAPRAITSAPTLHSCVWSPDGKQIACVSLNVDVTTPGLSFGNLGPSEILLIPEGGGQPTRLVHDGHSNLSPTWLPNGTLLFISDRDGGRDVYAVRPDMAEEGVSPDRLTTGLNPISISTSANGSRILFAAFTEISNIWWMPIPASGTASVAQAQPLTMDNQVIEGFDVSRDGRWITFASERSGNSDIYRMRLESAGEAEQLTRGDPNEFSPVFSPDNQEISYHANREGLRQIEVIPANGGVATYISPALEDNRAPIWLPDGQSILFNANEERPGSMTMMVNRSKTGSWSVPKMWRRPPVSCTASPHDSTLACAELSGRLVVTNLHGETLRVLVDGSTARSNFIFPGWSSDGTRIYYLSLDSVGTTIQSISASGGSPRVVLRFDDPTRPWHRYGFRVSRDRFYFTLGDRQSDIWIAELRRNAEGR